MKNLLIPAITLLMPLSVHAQSTAEDIMNLLPELPSEVQIVGLAKEKWQEDSPEKYTKEFRLFIDNLAAAIGKGSDMASQNRKVISGVPEIRRVEEASGRTPPGSNTVAVPAATSSGAAGPLEETVKKYQELYGKRSSMIDKPAAIIEEARQQCRELYKTKYKAKIQAQETKTDKLWDRSSNNKALIKQAEAAQRQLDNTNAAFESESYIIQRKAILAAMQYIKTDYLAYFRALDAAAEAVGHPLRENIEMEVGMRYLQTATELSNLSNIGARE